jgi:hypothetical protein
MILQCDITVGKKSIPAGRNNTSYYITETATDRIYSSNNAITVEQRVKDEMIILKYIFWQQVLLTEMIQNMI